MPDSGTYRKKTLFRDRVKKQRYVLIMMAPAFILTFIFCYLPLTGWVMAFTDYKIGKSLFSGKFTGFLQFQHFLAGSKDFIYLIRNTLVINVSSVIINIFLAVVFAVLLNEIHHSRYKKTVQTITFFPFFISWVITYSVVWALFAVRSGSINQLLISLGIVKKGFNFLGDPNYSWGLMIVLNMWKYLGYNSIIFLAGISGISLEEYEAAAIDGASRFQRVMKITLPNLIPTASILLIMNSGWVFNSNLEQFFIFTNPTNQDKMQVLDMYIYTYGLKLTDYSYATAVGILKTAVSILTLWLVNRASRKLSDSAIF